MLYPEELTYTIEQSHVSGDVNQFQYWLTWFSFVANNAVFKQTN